MWRVLMAVVAGAFLVQMDLDVSVEERSLGADAALCADEVPGVEVTAPVAMPGGVPAGGDRMPCKCVPRCGPHQACVEMRPGSGYCTCMPKS